MQTLLIYDKDPYHALMRTSFNHLAQTVTSQMKGDWCSRTTQQPPKPLHLMFLRPLIMTEG